MSAPPIFALGQDEAVRARLLDGVLDRMPAAGTEDAARPVRAEVRLETADPLDWLRAQQASSRGFWSDREQRFVLAGIGRADTLTGEAGECAPWDALHARIANAVGEVRYLGGMRFDPAVATGPEWSSFGAYRFVLPRFEFVARDGECILAMNALGGEPRERLEEDLAALRLPQQPSPAPVLEDPGARADAPGREAWQTLVSQTLGQLRRGGFEKAVLARRATLPFARPPDAAHLLAALRSKSGNAFYFCFQPRSGHAFFGASPERLYRRDGRRVLTEAIAGTARRSADPIEDRRLGAALLESEKDRREQGYVVDAIRKVMNPFCEKLESDPAPGLLDLTRGRHLVTRFRGTLREGVTDGALVEGLHPTPAVGGFPRDEAMRHLAAAEPFDRGWFAGPVGWVGRDAAQFVVGIRSALVEEDRLHVYAGAGIVEGSDPAGEWEETEQKMGDLLAIFG